MLCPSQSIGDTLKYRLRYGSTAGIEVIQLAVSIGEVLLIEIRNRGFRDIADRVELDLADAVICVVAVLDEFPVAVAGVVSVTETGVGANALRR
ncbi:MAG: hypothetical protein ACOX3P_04955 [Saccharofermentanales bacterium]|jgi:ABC-type sulfate transport system substrate-binding protein